MVMVGVENSSQQVTRSRNQLVWFERWQLHGPPQF